MISDNMCDCDLKYDHEGEPNGSRYCEGKEGCREELSYFDLSLYLTLIILFLWVFF